MTRALVTGGAGFIGGWVVGALRARGWSVRVLDNLSTGSRSHVPSDVELVVADVCDRVAVMEAVRGCQAVFHLAAFTVVGESLHRIAECCQTNVVGTACVLGAMATNQVERIVFAGSSAVYAGLTTGSLAEDAPLQPSCVYGATKATSERLIHLMANACGLSAVVLRYFNVYGPGQDASSAYPSAIPSFLRRIEQERPLLVHGDGLQTRDFVYVEDVARANVAAAELPLQPGDVKTFNIGTGVSTRVIDLARRVNHLAGRPEDAIEFDDPIPAEQRHNAAAVGRAKTDLGWEAAVTLDEGLLCTWKAWEPLGVKPKVHRFHV